MPFLGRDWRSPGEQWVRTTEGWERLKMWRLKLLENLNENVIARLFKMAAKDNNHMHKDIDCRCPQPHVFVLRCITKEQKMQISIAEAFSRLDMGGAVKDLRRFNYVGKLLELLIRHKLHSLSGTAQKHVFNILEELLHQVVRTQNNVHVMQSLLHDVRLALEHGHYCHVGSSSLWAHHSEMVNQMQNTLNTIQLKEREEDGGVKMSDLPDDCIREILARLTDHKDIVHTGMTESRTQELTQERNVWQDLCLFHFDNQQIHTLMNNPDALETFTTTEWQKLYLRLTKRFGMRETYAEMLHLCRHCNALFWEHHGHPCLIPKVQPKSVPVSPVMCIELFTA